MGFIFEVKDKTGRKIRLTKKQWTHINKKHPAIANYLDEIKETIENPDAVIESEEENVYLYYKYYKRLKSPYNYILAIVKYLNGEGYIMSAYFEKNIM